MTTEVDVENPQGLIKAGMYAYVKLPLKVANQALAVPLQALTIVIVGPLWFWRRMVD